MSNQRLEGECIFCQKTHKDGHRISGEHLWPEWIKKVIPVRPGNRHFSTRIKYDNLCDAVVLNPEDVPHAGSYAGRKIKVPCKICNESWMSKIETDAIPTLTPLIEGKPCQISIDDQCKIATWAALRAIIIEFDDLSTMAISPAMWRQFANDRAPNAEWKIWIATNKDAKDQRYVHHGVTLAPECSVQSFGAAALRMNTQTTAIFLGKLYILVFSSFFPQAMQSFCIPDDTANSMKQVWPPLDAIEWPIKPNLSFKREGKVSNALLLQTLKQGQVA